MENYNKQIFELQTYLASPTEIDVNIVSIKNLIDKLISGFDEWEKWLYYEEYKYNAFSMPLSIVTPYPKYEVSSGGDLKTKKNSDDHQ